MRSASQELFLLAVNLSQYQNKDLIVKLFVESLNVIFAPHTFRWREKEAKKNDALLEVCTRTSLYGFVEHEKGESFPEEHFRLLQNAVQLLAMILEKLDQEQLLNNSKIHLQQLVDMQTGELLEKQKELKDQNEEYQVLNEELRQTNEELIHEKERSETNQNRLNEAQSIAHIGSWELDFISNRANWSEEASRIFDCKPDKIDTSYKTILNFVHPDDKQFVFNTFRHHLQTKKPYSITHRLLLSNGTCKYVSQSCKTQFTEMGKPLVSVGTVVDISDKVKADEALLRTQYSIDNITDGIFWVDESARFIFANKPACVNLEYSMEELLTLKVFDIDHGFTESNWGAHWDQILARDSFVIESVHYTKNGRPIPVEVTVNRVEYEGMVYNCAIARDITTRKKAEEELLIAKKKTEENEQRLLTFINSIPDIICYKDGKGNWLLANDADLELFCLKGIDYYGKNDLQLSEYTNQIYKNSFATCMKTDEKAWEKKSISKGVEIIPTVTGAKKVYEVYKVPTFYKNGDRKGLAVIGRDISELHETQEILVAAKEKAEQSDRLKSAFLANMSHEIRTPMNGILGFADLLSTRELTGEQQSHYLKIIEKSGKRMLNIINDIVDISKIESGLSNLVISNTGINHIMEEVYSFFKPEADEKELLLSYHTALPSGDAFVQTDADKVHAILANLVKNALKYTHQGSIEFGYRLSTGSGSDDSKHGWHGSERANKSAELEFYVKDTGIGISKDRQEAVFERFIQADIADRMAYQGAGLGLAISKAYVEMLGGKIWLESDEGIGSRFYFTLPYDIPMENEPHEPTSSATDSHDAPGKLKILIAEDDEASEILLTILAKDFCRELLIAKTGYETIDACRDNPDIDLILMDIQMPEMGGYEATRQIRALNKEVIIIAQTAFGLEGDREKSLTAGCNDYISKPIDRDEFLELIHKYFGHDSSKFHE